MDRDDWPTLALTGYDSAFTIPQHPKPNSIRARTNYYASHIKLGKPMPCCYVLDNPRAQYFATGFVHDSSIYYCTFAYNQELPETEPDGGIRYDRFTPEVQRVGTFRNALLWDCWFWNRLSEEWVQQELRIVQQFGEFPYYSQVDLRTSENSEWNQYRSAGIQCHIDTSVWARSSLPEDGPPEYPWTPAWDPWWLDQY